LNKQKEISAAYDTKQDGNKWNFDTYKDADIKALYEDPNRADELADYENWLAATKREREITQEITDTQEQTA